jgi:cyclophilin family peptidyl-prolyl cis-trans isomerase
MVASTPSPQRSRSAWQKNLSEVARGAGVTRPTHSQIVIECFERICPKTVANFVELVKGKHEAGRYEGTRMNRVVKKGWLQGGNIVPAEQGDVVKSIYGGAFADETFNVKHDKMVRPPLLLCSLRAACEHGAIVDHDPAYVDRERVLDGPVRFRAHAPTIPHVAGCDASRISLADVNLHGGPASNLREQESTIVGTRTVESSTGCHAPLGR